ncbi:DUF2971 domain-containing protein [Lederbergia ruris]|uniref:DUF2971 domain-containing protein n=1 Tax=Lederbergia ruris TaxID=217495 RepID=UPI0039A18F00
MTKDNHSTFIEYAFNSIEDWLTWSFLNRSDNGEYTPVYHYCSLGVMKSILQDEKLRFTDIRYLNDFREYTYVQDVYRQVCLDKKNQLDSTFFEMIYNDEIFSKLDGYQKDYMISSNDGTLRKFQEEPCRAFVCCFSLEKDELLMWNYYGSKNAGCNIEFSLMYPSSSLVKETIELKRSQVLYGEESYHAVKEIIDQAHIIWKSAKNNDFLTKFIIMQLNALRLFLKNEAFKNEREYRIVLLVPESKMGKLDLDFFERGNILIPHLDITLKDLNAEIKGINLGPYAGNELNKWSVNDLAKQNGLKEIPIDLSDVPMRNYLG